jgi:hypothetical protein
MRGIFYNSKKALCSIWESGIMCYNTLKHSTKYTLDYSEDCNLDFSYDFAIFNEHHHTNKWISEEMIHNFNKPTFCIVTEVAFSSNIIRFNSPFYSNYIVIDPTINETEKIHSFCRPIEDFNIPNDIVINYDIPFIFSFGFATLGKEWYKIVELVQKDYDNANIHFNIPRGTFIPEQMHITEINKIKDECKNILKKPGIKLKITQDNLSKDELLTLCSKSTINCFFYNRQHIFSAGISAVTDQAISSGRPLFVTGDCTFRHIHKYIDYYPNIGIKEAIEKTQQGVLKMKNEWSNSIFLNKFENILERSMC